MTESVRQPANKQANGSHKLTGPGPGRAKGSKNKITKNIKENFEAVFEKLGGVEGFAKWATKNNKTQGAFYQMYSKMLPSNVSIDGDLNLVSYEISERYLPKKEDDGKKKSDGKK